MLATWLYAALRNGLAPSTSSCHGSNSSIRLIGCSAMRASTVRRYASGFRPLSLGGTDQAVDRRRTLAARIGACEQIVLAPKRDRPDRVLHGIGVR